MNGLLQDWAGNKHGGAVRPGRCTLWNKPAQGNVAVPDARPRGRSMVKIGWL